MGLHILSLTLVMTVCLGVSAEVSEEISNLADVNTDFGLRMFREISKDSKNVFISPYSISTALALTYQGAAEETKAKMAEVLGFTAANTAHLNQNYKVLMEAVFEPGKKYTLKSANRLYGQQGKEFRQEFLDTLKTYYGASLEQVDFARDTEGARNVINSWVQEQTENAIRDLLEPGVLDPSAVLVLINAIYFKGLWSMPFNKSLTNDNGEFHVSETETVTVPMMSNMGKYKFVSDDELKGTLVCLPYYSQETEGDTPSPPGDVNMYVFLPFKGEDLTTTVEQVSAEKLNNMISKMNEVAIELKVPKFSITHRLSVKDTLTALGMGIAFSADADFSAMDDSKGLFIKDVIHQGLVEVNEEGTKAAAATAVIIGRSGPLEISLDRPFFFFIREEDTQSTLFLGRVHNPKTTMMLRRSTPNEPAAGLGNQIAAHMTLTLIMIICISILQFLTF